MKKCLALSLAIIISIDSINHGSRHTTKFLLDEADNHPIWIQAWGDKNTTARALESLEEEYPDKMDYVAGRRHFFFIWEQDSTYPSYMRPHWDRYDILTIICDQLVCHSIDLLSPCNY